jgi:hypothetical protein
VEPASGVLGAGQVSEAVAAGRACCAVGAVVDSEAMRRSDLAVSSPSQEVIAFAESEDAGDRPDRPVHARSARRRNGSIAERAPYSDRMLADEGAVAIEGRAEVREGDTVAPALPPGPPRSVASAPPLWSESPDRTAETDGCRSSSRHAPASGFWAAVERDEWVAGRGR